MDVSAIAGLARAAHDGALPFPRIVAGLLDEGVESYRVDFATMSCTYHGVDGAVVVVPLGFEGLPPIARDFDPVALKAAIHDSQANGQAYRRFCARALLAGVHAYCAYLRGQRVVYSGRAGDQHVEHFPGAGPGVTDAAAGPAGR